MLALILALMLLPKSLSLPLPLQLPLYLHLPPPIQPSKKQILVVYSHFTKTKGGDPNNTQVKYNYYVKVYECHYRRHSTF